MLPKPVEVMNHALENNEKEVDVAINCVNVQNTEMSTILPVRDEGTVELLLNGYTRIC